MPRLSEQIGVRSRRAVRYAGQVFPGRSGADSKPGLI